MLAYVLALVVGLSSIALYMAAFFFPEVHRKHDFFWSGLGMFYALVLWVCAGRITGGVLLGQTTSVALLCWLGWQTLALRRQVAPVEQQTAMPTAAAWRALLANAWVSLASVESIAPLAQPIGKQFAKLTAWMEALVTTTTKPTSASPAVTPLKAESESYVPLTPADFANASQDGTPTIATAATPVKGSKVQPGEDLVTTIVKQVQGAFKGLSAKPESKPVYVRKQFRQPEVETKPEVETRTEIEVTAVDVGDRASEPLPSVSDAGATVTTEAEAAPPAPPLQTVEVEVSSAPETKQ